jgi:hypothetical protein
VPLSRGVAANLHALAKFAGIEECNYSSQVSWTSSHPDIVSVSPDGAIHAHREGNMKISASDKNGVSTSIEYVVNDYDFLQCSFPIPKP